MANYDLGVIGLTVQSTGAEQATQEVKKLGAAAQQVMDDFNRMKSVMALAKKGTDEAAASFRRFSVQDLQQASQRMQGFERNLANSRRGMNDFGVGIQQAGYQIGDFLVQVQSGTNWMVAFGQQATQLVGILPMFASNLGMSVGSMIALSSGLGIAIPLLTAVGAAFMRSGEEASKGSSNIKTYEETLKTLNETIAETENRLIAVGRGLESNEITDSKLAVEELKKAFIELTQTEVVGFMDAWTRADRIREVLDLTLELEKGLKTTEAQAEAERMLAGNMSAAAAVQRNIVEEKQRELQAAKETEAANVRALQTYAATRMEANQTAEQIALIESGMSQAAVEALQFAGIDLSSGVSAAAKEAASLAAEMGIALSDAISLMNLRGSLEYSGRGGDPRDFMPGGSESYSAGAKPFTYVAPKKTGGGGGISAEERKLQTLIDNLQSEREVINEWYEESKTTLQTASETELSIIGGKHEAMLRLEQEYQDKLKGIRDENNMSALSGAETFFGGMADIARAGGDKTVKAMRIFSAAQALINSYVAFTEVLKDPSFIGRPWARFGAAASALSSGLAAVASIKSGSAGSVSRGSATVSSSSASSAASAPQTVFIDSIDPESLYSGKSLINLFDAFYNENDKRGKVFVVAR